jgi:serine/threonine protein kinase
MKLTSGARFGSYEVLEQIGLGGMGEVWRARDSELNRDVAIKVLPSAFLDDADRLARFRREAEILASLNHANIATIHGLAKIDDQTVIVMELVEGQTLADRIQDGPIPPDEAMDIALQIVSGLEAAHERQIVHRDLKPANVKIRRDGTVKLLDFGISKPIDPSAISGSPVMTTPAVTQTGVILGTAAYMSPEQAQGKFVDQRTDIWAFGCLLFEMLTGQPAFDGENVMEILARVIDRDTDLSAVPSTLNPPVRHTLKLCLEKDPRRRIADIRDVRLALEDRLWASADPAAAQAANGSRMLPWTLAAVAVVAAGAAIMSQFLSEADEQPRSVEHLEILHMPEAAIGYDLSLVRDIAMSPDDSNLVYGSFARVGPMFWRPLESDVAEPLLGTEGGSSPVFSPDSRHIAFF